MRTTARTWLTPQQVAEELGVSVDTVRRWCHAGTLPAIVVERTTRIERGEFERWLEARTRRKVSSWRRAERWQ